MDLQDDTLTRTKKGSPEDRLPDGEAYEEEQPDHPMDAREIRERHAMLVSKYRHELEVQADNRAEMAIDEDYYDHIQLTAEQVKELEDRGQAPIVYNVIAQTVNWVIGSEKRGRTDFKILPRGKEDAKPAEAKTKYMKYVSDIHRTPFNRSRSFEDGVKVGLGWIETCVPDEDDDEPTGDRYESWRNMLYDSASSAMDTSDMRYQFRSKWLDEDIAIAMFPHCADKIRDSVSEVSSWGSTAMLDGDQAMDGAEAGRELFGGANPIYLYKRRRVRMIEAWYREPMTVQKIRGGAFKGDIYDENDPRHADEVQTGRATLHEKVVMRVRVMFMTVTHPLYDDLSPFKHNRLKFIPVWGYRRGRDNLPYGIIRGLRGPQDGVNKRASKALYIMSTNKVLMEENILPDDVTPDDFAEEVSRPDAIIRVKSGKIGAIALNVDRELAPAHMEQMSRDIAMIQQVGGVTDELLGKTTNAQSGVAVKARQEQGSLATSKFFDNLRFAAQLHGEITLCNIEQFVTEQKQFRVTNQRGTPEYITMNDGLPENDITRSKADFVISESDYRATMRQASLEVLTEMISKMPAEVGMALLDLVVELMDVENRDEIAKRVRGINGMRDPDATELTPEEQASMAAKQEADAAQKEMFMAELREKNAKAAKAEADTDLTKGKTVEAAMNAASLAMTAATAVIQMPTIAKVADNLLIEGGWNGGTPVPSGMMPTAAQGMPQGMNPAAQQPPAPPEQMVPPVEQQPQPQQGAVQ
jgi:hypothetical protein